VTGVTLVGFLLSLLRAARCLVRQRLEVSYVGNDPGGASVSVNAFADYRTKSSSLNARKLTTSTSALGNQQYLDSQSNG
jgi:hypothetical protein